MSHAGAHPSARRARPGGRSQGSGVPCSPVWIGGEGAKKPSEPGSAGGTGRGGSLDEAKGIPYVRGRRLVQGYDITWDTV
jgi:hypothetical protein